MDGQRLGLPVLREAEGGPDGADQNAQIQQRDAADPAQTIKLHGVQQRNFQVGFTGLQRGGGGDERERERERPKNFACLHRMSFFLIIIKP